MDSILLQAVKPELIILIPVLNVIGAIIKSTPAVKNWSIPYILIGAGIVLAIVYQMATGDDSADSTGMLILSGAVQGFLCALSAVGGHQSVKQITEKNED